MEDRTHAAAVRSQGGDPSDPTDQRQGVLMKYAYYPGCSLKSSGRAYEESFLAVCKILGLEMEELDNWNCCGATSFMSIEQGPAYTCSVRNLALAEKKNMDLVAPCGGCYGVLLKADHYYADYPAVRNSVDKGLAAEGLQYRRQIQIRHPMELLTHDPGLKAIRSLVKRPLKGLRVASYYGCRFLRPVAPFDDMRHPQTMDSLMKTVGARIADYASRGRCCGGALAGSIPKMAQELTYRLIKDAQKAEADVIVTGCPLCQFNLDAFQDEIIASHPDVKPIPVFFFTQLLGLALGAEPEELGIQRLIVPGIKILQEKGILGDKKADEKKVPVAAGAQNG
ncbi:MAG: CoB--CoM heterodisulfide reductase iron-sulfur subunit B family protein [Armatimonadetes bacterium]|nr:CoB--CoM heterodisulfide reductase iron-sulfur subunit B family protein [Armatimonadota bacterium]